MKKLLLLFLSLFLVTGCAGMENTINEFKNKVEKSKNYVLEGTMELCSDEETFNYNVKVNYLKDNYYKVEMVNTQNNHTQIILKNDEGLYVKTQESTKQKLNVI